jgi:hypothetical protein
MKKCGLSKTIFKNLMIKEAQNAIWFLSLCILVVCKHMRNCTQEKSLLLFQPDLISQYPFLSRIHTTILHPTQNNSKRFQWSEQHRALFSSWVSSVNSSSVLPITPICTYNRPKKDIPFNPILSFGCLVEAVLPFAASFCIQYHSIHKENLLAQTGNMTTLNYHNIYCARAK